MPPTWTERVAMERRRIAAVPMAERTPNPHGVAPWIAAEIGEFREEELPPFAEYIVWMGRQPRSGAFARMVGLEEHARKWWAKALDPLLMLGIISATVWGMVTYRNAPAVALLLAGSGTAALVAGAILLHKHSRRRRAPCLPRDVMFPPDAAAVEALALLPISMRELLIAQYLLMARQRRIASVVGTATIIALALGWCVLAMRGNPAVAAAALPIGAWFVLLVRHLGGSDIFTTFMEEERYLEEIRFVSLQARRGIWGSLMLHLRRGPKMLAQVVASASLSWRLWLPLALTPVIWAVCVALVSVWGFCALALALGIAASLPPRPEYERNLRHRLRWRLRRLSFLFELLRNRQLAAGESSLPLPLLLGR